MSDFGRINPVDLDRYITGDYGERQFRAQDSYGKRDPAPGVYGCLACRLKIEIADGDQFPGDDERCSHQWEQIPLEDLS